MKDKIVYWDSENNIHLNSYKRILMNRKQYEDELERRQEEHLKKVHQQAGKYVIMMVLFHITNLFLLYLLVEYVHLWYLTAQVIISILLTIVSYLISWRIFVD